MFSSRLFLLIGLSACRTGPATQGQKTDTGTLNVDADGDGYGTDEDCDDNDASINPGAVEVCDGVDNNCTDGVDEGVSSTWYEDRDEDGFGREDAPIEACDQPPGAVPSSSDCDDDDPTVYPSAPEECDGEDNNCDGEIDEGLADVWYPDEDGDGFGDEASPEVTCTPAEGWTRIGRDCNDAEASAFPGAVEVCDGVDNDCDGLTDEETGETFYADVDGDGYGDDDSTIQACELPESYSAVGGDCDDNNFDTFPGAPEFCNGTDDDCDGTVDEPDARDASVWHLDDDGDGYGLLSTSTIACDAPSGYVAPTADFDCDDSEATTYPGATEYCDGHDDDCDGIVDEADAVDATTWYADSDGDGYGGTTLTLTQCNQPSGYVADNTDCDDLDSDINPGETEICNGVDDDCSGTADDGLATATYFEDSDGDGYGDASSTLTDCELPSGYVTDDTDCDDTNSDVNPDADEVCNTIDDDCDGDIDDDDSDVIDSVEWFADTDGDGYGDAGTSLYACEEPSSYTDDDTDCDDGDSAVFPGAPELCNGIDDNCDGDVDDGTLGSGSSCAATDCAEILADDPTSTDGTYTLTRGSYYCDMSTDGGGWTRVGASVAVWGTSYDTSYYNSEGFTWDEALFAYASGSVHAHCTYPGSLTGCNNIGMQFGSESWGVARNWGSSICGMSTTSYTSATTYIGGYDWTIYRSTSTDTIRVGTLEGISSCTIGDNPGTAYMDIYVRR